MSPAHTEPFQTCDHPDCVAERTMLMERTRRQAETHRRSTDMRRLYTALRQIITDDGTYTDGDGIRDGHNPAFLRLQAIAREALHE